jgi:hypothetical protein
MEKTKMPLALILLCLPWTVFAQAPGQTPVHWAAVAPGSSVKPGETIEIKLEAKIDGDWHLYSTTTPPGGPNPTRISLVPGSPFQLQDSLRQSPPQTQFDANFGIQTEFYADAADF